MCGDTTQVVPAATTIKLVNNGQFLLEAQHLYMTLYETGSPMKEQKYLRTHYSGVCTQVRTYLRTGQIWLHFTWGVGTEWGILTTIQKCVHTQAFLLSLTAMVLYLCVGEVGMRNEVSPALELKCIHFSDCRGVRMYVHTRKHYSNVTWYQC